MLEQVDLEVESIVNQGMDGVSEAEVRSIRTEIEPILFLYQGVHDIERILRRRKNVLVWLCSPPHS